MNPEIWIQLSIDQHQKTSKLLEEHQHHTNILLNTMQKLQEEMVHVSSDNEHLMHEWERILKSLSNKKNEGVLQPNSDRGIQEENKRQNKYQTMDRMVRIPS